MIFAFRGQDHPVFAAQHRPSELAGMTTSARPRTSSYGRRQLTVIDCDHRSAQAGNPVAVLASAIPRQGGLCSIGRGWKWQAISAAQCDLTPARHDLSYARPQLSLPWPCPCPQFLRCPCPTLRKQASRSFAKARDPGRKEKQVGGGAGGGGRWIRHGGGEMEREESGKEEGKVWWLKQCEEQDSTLYSCSAHEQARRGRQVHHARTGLD
ncbi:predicted protein [Coccidioides posadasii str. Silveira]|uniref:Predicted protein n=1 Tax=Coccidioides posadasii (strain RMSCC 757 / Silveira) TaxID=443226 RepID=E9DFE6_COCPS|nr:predicted protein [Coccidioides posadasii str. Silveira]